MSNAGLLLWVYVTTTRRSVVLRYYLQATSRSHWHRGYPNRGEHNGNIDDSLLMSPITLMIHQFYIEHRKHR